MIEEELDELRPSAFAIAYRMLGSVSEGEDVVQEGSLRLHRARAGGERIESPRASRRWSRGSRSTTSARRGSARGLRRRVAARAARGERRRRPGPQGGMAESLSHELLVLLESLSPEQRAAFFFARCSTSPTTGSLRCPHERAERRQSRQCVRHHVNERRPRFEASREQREESVTLLAAAEEGDLAGRGVAGPRRRVPRRRRRQGARRRTGDPGRARVARLLMRGARRRPLAASPCAAGGERATGCAVLRPRGQADSGDP